MMDRYYYERLAAWYEGRYYRTGVYWWGKLAAEFYEIAARMRR